MTAAAPEIPGPDAATLQAVADALDAASSLLRQRIALSQPYRPSSSPFLSAAERARELHHSLGDRQVQVLTQLDQAGKDGTTTGHISRKIDYGQPNVYLTLRRLQALGLVQKDESAHPHIYRLAGPLVPGWPDAPEW